MVGRKKTHIIAQPSKQDDVDQIKDMISDMDKVEEPSVAEVKAKHTCIIM